MTDTFKPTVQTIAGYAIRVEEPEGGRFYTQLYKHPMSSGDALSAAKYAHGSRCTYEAVPLVEAAGVKRLEAENRRLRSCLENVQIFVSELKEALGMAMGSDDE